MNLKHCTNLRLTPREQDVAELLAQGKRQVDIARLLTISVRTVQVHERNIQAKMKADSRFEVALRLCVYEILGANP